MSSDDISHEEKTKWNQDEIDRLIRAVCICKRGNGKTNWVQVAQRVGTRNRTQCCQRYTSIDGICSSKDKRCRAWSRDEERLLLNLFPLLGNSWMQYPERIQNRTYNDIKSKFTNLYRNCERGYKCFPEDPELESQLAYCCRIRSRLGRGMQDVPYPTCENVALEQQVDVQAGGTIDPCPVLSSAVPPNSLAGSSSSADDSILSAAYDDVGASSDWQAVLSLGSTSAVSEAWHTVRGTCRMPQSRHPSPHKRRTPVVGTECIRTADGKELTEKDLENMLVEKLGTLICTRAADSAPKSEQETLPGDGNDKLAAASVGRGFHDIQKLQSADSVPYIEMGYAVVGALEPARKQAKAEPPLPVTQPNTPVLGVDITGFGLGSISASSSAFPYCVRCTTPFDIFNLSHGGNDFAWTGSLRARPGQ